MEQQVKEEISSIRAHLKNIKERQDADDIIRIQMNHKLDLIVNSLTDTEFNGKNGHITRLNSVEKLVTIHDLYWKIIFALFVPIYGSVIALLFKTFVK
jgi:hypothetical protein